MQAFHSFSLSALLLVASAPAFALPAGDAAQAIAAPLAPAIQVAPVAPVAPIVQAAPTTPIAPVAPIAPAVPAAQGAQAVPSLPALGGSGTALGALVNPQTLALLDSLSALQVTPQQALGGVGALLGLAQNRLAGDQYAQLAGAVPGLELLGGNGGNGGNAANGLLGRLGALSGLLGGSARQAPAQSGAPAGTVDSLEDVNQAFSALGMGVGLVGQFAPILLQFLGNQGVAGSLLQSLGGIWGVPAALAPAPVSGVSAPAAAGAGS